MNFKYFFFLTLFGVLQAAFLPAIFPGYPIFNFGLTFCLLLVFIDLSTNALWAALIFGLLLDFFSFTSLGFSSLFFVLTIFVAEELKKILGVNVAVASVV